MNAKSRLKENNKLFVKADAAWDKGDLRGASELFRRAAERGHSASQSNLGYFYDCGLHMKKDSGKALHWYYQAYRQGDASAANNIATVHRDCGRVGKMIWWFRRAIAMGDHDPLLDLGKYYETGVGVVMNLKKAIECYDRILGSKWVTEQTREQAQKRLAKLQKHQRNKA